ncbi:MAG: folate family ECF transporter S component [Clostridia bacterium]|nr:folate family ECF transporter S component [Clostridia bacterium]
MQAKNKKSPQTGRENGLWTRVKSDLTVFGNLRVLCAAAMLAAMSLILGKFLQIPNPFQNVIRISFENLPVILSGIAFGPFMGAMTGVVADLLGCMLYGYDINPLVMLGAGVVGLTAGILARYVLRRPMVLQVAMATASAHLLGSVLVKSFGLAAWYLGSYNMGLSELVAWRLLTYAIVGTAECVILCLLLRHRALSQQLERMRKK